jgi:hypothetical protein
MLNFIARFSVLIAAIVWIAGMGFSVSHYPEGTPRWIAFGGFTLVAIAIILFGNNYKRPNLPDNNNTTRT